MSKRSLSRQVLFLIFYLVVVAPPALQAQSGTPDSSAAVTETASTTSAPQRAESSNVQRPNTGVGETTHEIKKDLEEHLKPALIIEYASFIIAVVTCVFAVLAVVFAILAVVGVLERRALATQFDELKQERLNLQMRIETFKSEIQVQERRLAANQRFLEAVLSRHSTLLVGIVEAFGAALKPEEAHRLKSLIFEAEAAMDLFYPQETEVFKALLRLEQVGSDGCVSSLAQLRDDETVDAKTRLRALEVLTKVKERLKHARPQT